MLSSMSYYLTRSLTPPLKGSVQLNEDFTLEPRVYSEWTITHGRFCEWVQLKGFSWLEDVLTIQDHSEIGLRLLG